MDLKKLLQKMDKDLSTKKAIRICYKKEDEMFLVQTVDPRALALKIDWHLDSANQCWQAELRTLPKLENVRWVKYRIRHASKQEQKRMAIEYKNLLDLRKQADEIQARLLLAEENLLKELRTTGTNLKPAAPNDREMFLAEFSTRLHNQLALTRRVDNDAVFSLAARHPRLKKAIYKRQVLAVDRGVLNQILPTLDKKVAQQILKFEPVYRFMEIPLSKPECENCGGKVYKNTGVCRRCGHVHAVNPTKQERKRSRSAA